jgi:anti-sigma regulatory factor (Ser/Thr protein kinase)
MAQECIRQLPRSRKLIPELPGDDWPCEGIEEVELPLSLAHGELDIRSSLLELPRARAFVRSICRSLPDYPLDEVSIAQLELAVTEAASNIMKHAHHGCPDQWIHLEGEASPADVTIRLEYVGDPFDPSTVSPPAFNSLRESGYGLFLITQSVDEVRHYQDECGINGITLVKIRKA